MLEAAFAGYGASGRNGGWVTSELPGSRARYARGPGGVAGVRALEAELRSTVDEVGRVCEAESIDCDFVKGGRLSVATTASQLARLREGVAAIREWGDGDDVYEFLSPAALRARVNVAGALAGLYAPASARIQPAALAAGIAAAAERRGVRHLRGDAGHRHRAVRAARRQRGRRGRPDEVRRRAGAFGAALHRGLHGRPARAAPSAAADEQPHDRDRAALAAGVAGDRLERGGNAGRRGPRVHVRAAHRRRPDRARRARRALPVRLGGGPAGADGSRDRGRADRRAAADVPGGGLGPDRARLVRRARRAARLVRHRHL